jgi:hypothetical protein
MLSVGVRAMAEICVWGSKFDGTAFYSDSINVGTRLNEQWLRSRIFVEAMDKSS